MTVILTSSGIDYFSLTAFTRPIKSRVTISYSGQVLLDDAARTVYKCVMTSVLLPFLLFRRGENMALCF
ncbi:uncharacterized [Tachysurus ichikawai]